MRVKTELVLEQLVSRVLGRALELRSMELSDDLDQVLESGPEPIELARFGYACRVAETDLFERARAPTPGLVELLAERSAEVSSREQAISVLCRELAAEEPDDKPDPGDGSWLVPGPGGHVRHFLALAAADELSRQTSNGEPRIPRELSAGEAKRCFLYGFYARCCEELAPG